MAPQTYDSDSDSDEDNEPHYISGVQHNGDNQRIDAEGDADDELEVQDEDMVAFGNEYPPGDDNDGYDSDDESEISSSQDDDSSDSEVDAGILDDLTDEEAQLDMSFQELQQRLRETEDRLRQRNGRVGDLESSLNQSLKRESKLQQENQTLQATIRRLRNQLHGIRDPPEPWQALLARGEPRNNVWRAFARQNNMSTRIWNRHPDLNWGRPENREEMDDSGYESANSDDFANDGEALARASPEPIGSEIEPELGARNFVFDFEMFPLKAQERIFRYLFVKTELIHCISRFDLDGDDDTVFHRFHVGSSSCSIRRAHRPASILKYFLVSKRWLYMGVNCFFSQNTFAFSSLGEFGTFMAWLPRARRERIQHLEIFWQGSVMPRHETRINQRTLPLTYLCKALRLKTLVVHIQETGKRARRRYERLEPDELDDLVSNKIFGVGEIDRDSGDPYQLDPCRINPYKLMKRATGAQPNFRANRSMRTCHGMDYVYQLRGMRWIRFKQTDTEDRQNIRDWSFVEDLNSVATMPKAPRDASRSELENLCPISTLSDFIVSDADWETIYRWYGQTPLRSVLGDTLGAPSIPPSETDASTVLGLISSDNSEGNDDSDGSDGSPSSGGSDGSGDNDDGGGSENNGGSDSDSAVADLDSDLEVEIEGSPGHDGNINAATPQVIDLTLDYEDEPDPGRADLHAQRSFSLGPDNASGTRSTSESLFVRLENGSDKGSRSESLFVRSDSTSSGSVKVEEPGDGAQQKRFVIDLTTVDEETEPSSQDAAGPPKQGTVPTKGQGKL